MPPLRNPAVADAAPNGPALTVYDEHHAVTYVRMLDAEAAGADWREVSKIVLRIDPEREPDRARRAYDSHLGRAEWVARVGYSARAASLVLTCLRLGSFSPNLE